MKIIKKKRLALGCITVLSLLAVVGLNITLPKKSQAAGQTYTASWVDRSTIQIGAKDGSSGVLVDGQWDGNWEYTGMVASDQNLADCSSDTTINGFGSNQIVGLTGVSGSGPWDANASKANIYLPQNGCTAGYQGPINISNPENAKIFFSWTDSKKTSIERVDGDGSWILSGGQKTSSGKTRYYRESEAGSKCQDVIDVDTNKNSMILYEQTTDKNNSSGVTSPVDGNCYLVFTLNALLASSDSQSVVPSNMSLPLGDLSTRPTSKGSPGSTNNQNDKGQACFQNSSGSPLTWLLCPILDAASGMTNALVRMFEDQLSFTVPVPQAGQTSTNSLNVSSLGNIKDTNSGAYKTYKAWSYIRVIATILIVIMLLIMVVSQAIGTGIFDAYTVRKLLPKLIIAAILMQVSWYVFAWVVNVVDDIGRGLADLMFAPFGGASNLDLWRLMANAKLSGGLLFAVNWGGLLGLAYLGVALPFTMLGVALMAVLAILAGLMTLIFRKILIIMALVVSPLALAMWIMPGTDRYWKLWKDNFTKALLMFPLAVLIIASGRIFAYIAGTQDNSQLLNLIFILAGFFMPLFILPKTFQWGGSAMKLAGDAAFKASKKVSEKPKAYFDARQEEYNNQKKISAAERLRQWDQGELSRRGKLMSALRGDKFKSGDWDPAYTLTPVGRREMMRQRQEKMQRFRAQAVKHEDEEREFAKQKVMEEAVHAIPDNPEDHLWTVWNDRVNRTEAERYAALEKMAEIGGEPNLRRIQQAAFDEHRAGGERSVSFGKFADRKSNILFQKLPNLPYYKGAERVASGLKAEDFTTISEAATSEILSELQPRAAAGDTGAQQALDNFYTAFQLAASSDITKGRIATDVISTVSRSLGAAPPTTARSVNAALSSMGSGVPSSPSEIKIQHNESYQANVPEPATIAPAIAAGAPPNPNREAYKGRLLSDPATAQALANGLAYNVSPADRAAQLHVLQELHTEITNPPAGGTPDPNTVAAYNRLIDQIQQAYSERARAFTGRAAARGRNPADSAATAQTIMAPDMANIENLRIRAV